MNIIEVIPVSRAIGADTLSYFTSKEIPIGAVVDIPLRKKLVQGIVISSRIAEDMKSEIRSADFAMRKIDKIKSIRFFSKAFINMARDIADYYATSIGSVIDILVPDYILKNIVKLKINKVPDSVKVEKETIKEKYAVQGDDEERYSAWKSLIRQEFARRKSVLFVFPTIEDTERAYELLEKGVPGYVFILNGSLSQKEIITTWNKIIKESHPVVIIATGGFLSLYRSDIETIVIERENSKAYKIPRRPYLDIRHVVEILSEKLGIKIFFADNMLRVETLWREAEGKIVETSPFKFRSLSTATDILIDMKSYKSESGTFRVLSEEVERLINKTRDESEHTIILTTRRGLSGTVICEDCQNIVLCNNCSSPVVLHKAQIDENRKNFFMCHRCGERRSAEEYCKTCGSWKLTMVGIGIDLIIEKIKEKFPDITLFKIDSDSTSSTKGRTEKSAKAIIQKFKSKPGSILIGTEMMLQYMHERVENSAIISLDSLFTLPDFRIQEKILYILIRMRAITTKIFIAQTRKIDEKVFEYGLKGNMSDFYKETVEERRKFNYPPFTTLIKLTLNGKKDKIVEDMEEAQNILDPYEVEVFPAFTHTVKGNFVLHGLLRIPSNTWPDMSLIDKIRLLSPAITVKVDPETLL